MNMTKPVKAEGLQSGLSSAFTKFEQTVFRSLNAVVEPAVRMGIGSPTLTPASLIVLETVGFKSGMRRRTPLWSVRLGRYRVISTARGQRSFWVKNLLKNPAVSFYLGGRRRESQAIVIAKGKPMPASAELTPALRRLSKVLMQCAPGGWTFAILAPHGK
jgi:deazaflavin-dependent oxidoreductase (nitroreductase family)